MSDTSTDSSQPSMDYDPDDPIDLEAMTLVQAFIMLNPRINVQKAFDILRSYIDECNKIPDFYAPDTMAQVVDLILQVAVDGKKEAAGGHRH